jgi:hypothetical protein
MRSACGMAYYQMDRFDGFAGLLVPYIVMCKSLREQGVVTTTNFYTFKPLHLMQNVFIRIDT